MPLPPRGSKSVRWLVHLRSRPESVFDMLATDAGRERFWAEDSRERDEIIHFTFPDRLTLDAEIIEKKPPERFVLEYFGSIVTFDLKGDGRNGTDLTLSANNVKHFEEELPGWVSVLLALKAAVDFSVDLRNHDPSKTWNQGYADN